MAATVPHGGRAWPGNVPRPVEAAGAIGRGLEGEFDPPGTPLAAVAGILGGLSPFEKAVLADEPQPVDSEPIRRAVVTRVRVAVALATAPQGPGGSPVDAAAVSALLSDIDALLAEVNALVASAPAAVQPSLEQVRNALVKEAIDFSEVAHRAVPPELAAEVRPSVQVRKAVQTRVVSVASKAEQQLEAEQARRNRGLYLVLSIVAIGAAVYGYSWYRGAGRDRPSGAPADVFVIAPRLPGGAPAPITIKTRGGRAFSPAELTELTAQQATLGNTVRVVAPNVVVVSEGEPASAAPSPVR